jgi:beta-glucosidase
VVSDCEAVRNIFNGHHYKQSQAEASASSLKTGMDNECIDFTAKVTDDHDYIPYVDAVKQGHLTEAEIDVALKRLFTARIKLGMFDPPDLVPYTKIDDALLDGPAHRAMARKLANESMVLLKNDGVLPLKTKGTKIAVVGPLAEQTTVLLGNYNGTPTHSVSIVDGLKAEIPKAQVNFVPGTQFLSKVVSRVPDNLLTIDGQPGVRADYYSVKDMLAFISSAAKQAPLASRKEQAIGVTGSKPPELANDTAFAVSWEATFTPPEGGDYYLGFRGAGFLRVWLDGKVFTMAYEGNGRDAKLGRVKFEARRPYALRVDYAPKAGSNAPGELVWSKFDPHPSPEATAAASAADVVVAVVGLTSELEGEEMAVSEEGFKGGDRTTLDLPRPEEDLLKAMAATGKPLIVVLLNGSALSVNWAKQYANAILEGWYPGEEGGSAVAQTLAGINNPAGRLPITFYSSVNDLPPFEDYSMANRTYRYFRGTPLYPFGYGLSYSEFKYDKVKLSAAKLNAGEPLTVEATVKNTSKRDGDEVVQVYLTFPKLPGAPNRALCGFQRVHIAAGKTEHMRLTIDSRTLSHVNETGERLIGAGAYTLSIGGGQPGTAAHVVETPFTINGEVRLPE